MAIYEATREVEIEASACDCFAVLTDYERIPEWHSRVTACRVLSRDEQGRGRDIEFEVDAKLRTVRYRLRHRYEDCRLIAGEYLDGDFETFEGEYVFAEDGGRTLVTFGLRIDPGVPVPALIARTLNEAVMGRALSDLKERVEALATSEPASDQRPPGSRSRS
jgi:ribosome-associated toxin RatA of RatAB toxin-antitoxin module